MRFSMVPFLLLVIPVLEIAAFIVIGQQIGVLATLLMILVTAILGSILLRIQGFQIITRINEATARGELPGRELGHGAMILVAGVLLLTPGFITDFLGFVLFIPQARSAIWQMIRTRITILSQPAANFHQGSNPPHGSSRADDVVDLSPEEFHETGPGKSGDGKSPWVKQGNEPKT